MQTSLRFLVAIALFLATIPLALGQDEQPFGFRLTEWNETLAQVRTELERRALTSSDINALRDRLARLKSQATTVKTQSERALEPLRVRLAALGPPPAEEEPPESSDIEALRGSINEQIADYEGRIKQVGLVTAKAQQLDSQLSAYTREQTIEEILSSYPLPLAPTTIAIAVPEMLDHVAELVRAPGEWWTNLSDQQRQNVVLYRVVMVLALAVAIGLALRRVLLRSFGRNPAITDPSYARRVAAAVAEGLADGLIPALILGGILIRAADAEIMSGLFRDMVLVFCFAAMIFVVTWALARAALAPDLPSWRLESIEPHNAKRLSNAIVLLAAIFAVDLFLLGSTESLAVSQELDSVYELVTSLVEAALVLHISRGALWARDEENDADNAAEEEDDKPAQRATAFWRAIRIAVRVVAIAAIVAVLAGYAGLTAYLMNNLLATGVVGGFLFLVRGLLRELIGAGLRSRFMLRKLGIRHNTRSLLKFWLRTILDLLILLVGLLSVLPIWGVPARDMLIWISEVLQGFTIGNVTISMTDALVGVGIFAGILILTRMLQRFLSERVLPQTTLDTGVQNSLSAGLGYIGLVLAVALAITAVGLDLSNLALIAGALSVGIGFGLQNVVNNFVSGLILLIERPIKVGDWIIASGHEGYVKRINVRATELETFQRASVIIPNSELISTSVINWTHKNKLGRVEVPVGVAYGSDIEKVMALMKDCLHADSRIAKWPEPYVLFRGFGDSSLDFEARGYLLDVGDVLSVGSDYRVALYKAFEEEGVEIPFPQQDLHVKDLDRLVGALSQRGGQASPRETTLRRFTEAPESHAGDSPGEEADKAPPPAEDGKPQS